MATEREPQSKEEGLKKRRDELLHEVGVFEAEKRGFESETRIIEEKLSDLMDRKNELYSNIVALSERQEAAEKELKRIEAELASFKI